VNQPDLGSAGKHAPACPDQVGPTSNRVVQANQSQWGTSYIDRLAGIDQQFHSCLPIGVLRRAVLDSGTVLPITEQGDSGERCLRLRREIRHLLHHLPRLCHISGEEHDVWPLAVQVLQRSPRGKLVSGEVHVGDLSNPKTAQRIGKSSDSDLMAAQQYAVSLDPEGIGGNCGTCRTDTGEKAPARENHQLPRRA
jgi:hypothetical protein